MKIIWAFLYGWIARLLFSRPTSPAGWARVGLLVLAGLLVLDTARYLAYPDVSALATINPAETAMMAYREAQLADEGRKVTVRQSWVGLTNISPYVSKAVLIAEDDKFWTHEGFDFEALGKAIEKDIKERKLKFGGSTISQQLAKNLYLSPSKNPVRKIKEAILTWRIERTLTKKRILELYLNVAEWGDGIFGIEAAAKHYYGVPASALGPREAASLAAILPNPRRYSPVKPSGYVEGRSKVIFNIMLKRGIVAPEFQQLTQPGATGGYSVAAPAPVFNDTISAN